jgi:hypothetical protein
MMNTLHRTPQAEDGRRNIILQNRCGNRLTLLMHANRIEMEFIYKPNAFRRKDLRGRTFSTRDNCTFVFKAVALPEVGVEMVKQFDYDPFVTRLRIAPSELARNQLTFINVADENVFALSARAPLAVTFRPHADFRVRDGLLLEAFRDRGEDLVSFVAFPGFEDSRYRVLDDGTHVLQLIDNDVILIGAEENEAQVERLLRKFASPTLDGLLAHNEAQVAPVLVHGHAVLRDDPKLQQVLDLNRRLTWSAFDAGGVTFGSLPRIYMLTWIRDGAMSSTCFARAGLPDMLKLWAPFLLGNPSTIMDEKTGRMVREHIQLVGTRWNKSEDDGIYYATLSLFFLVQCAGDQVPLSDGTLQGLLEIIDRVLDTRFDADMGLFGSNTLGEDSLSSSPCYGYDRVNGTLYGPQHASVPENGKVMERVWTLYQNMNMYNVLRMALVLCDLSGVPNLKAHRERYRRSAEHLEQTLERKFIGPDGEYLCMCVRFTNGAMEWRPYGRGVDHWEHAWALTAGPFLPHVATSLKSVRTMVQRWPTIRTYGYCPWNFLAAFLHEHGVEASEAFRSLLDEQLTDALRLTETYPMAGALTEYQGWHEGWRGLPFGTGSLVLAVNARLLSVRLGGLTARANRLIQRVECFHWRSAVIETVTESEGDVVTGLVLNGEPVEHTLILPQDRLRFGHNTLAVHGGNQFGGCRLFDSDAELLSAAPLPDGAAFRFRGALSIRTLWDNMAGATFSVVDAASGKALKHTTAPAADTGRTLMTIPGGGEVIVTLKVRHLENTK